MPIPVARRRPGQRRHKKNEKTALPYVHAQDGNSKSGNRLGDNFNERLTREGQSIAAAPSRATPSGTSIWDRDFEDEFADDLKHESARSAIRRALWYSQAAETSITHVAFVGGIEEVAFLPCSSPDFFSFVSMQFSASAEPLYIRAQNELRVDVRVRAEGAAVFSKTLARFLGLAFAPPAWALVVFAAGQAAYTLAKFAVFGNFCGGCKILDLFAKVAKTIAKEIPKKNVEKVGVDGRKHEVNERQETQVQGKVGCSVSKGTWSNDSAGDIDDAHYKYKERSGNSVGDREASDRDGRDRNTTRQGTASLETRCEKEKRGEMKRIRRVGEMAMGPKEERRISRTSRDHSSHPGPVEFAEQPVIREEQPVN
ncbi:hypothetical protein EDB89DRAFT_2241640 [Lactarius sanguifluus]|nr:hypothetical protein EDB89DRAFT_2241640 [Lactarius sanguifluus]